MNIATPSLMLSLVVSHESTCLKECCQFVPPHIAKQLSIFDGESLEIETHSPASQNYMHSGARAREPQKRIIKIQQTLHSLNNDHSVYVSNDRRTMFSGAKLSATSSFNRPTFPVYDLDGATDYIRPDGKKEYEKEMQDYPTAKLSGDIEKWPPNAQRACEGAKKVWEFFLEEFQRNSIDGAGMDIVSCVRLRSFTYTYDVNGLSHLVRGYDQNPVKGPVNNAFWDGKEMVYGEGDGMIYSDFTASDEVIAHEITHGITQHTCNLKYVGQSGALNEHISDVFGVVFKHKSQRMNDPSTANWLMGEKCISENFKKMVDVRGFGFWHALRSMKSPGTAYAVTKGSTKANDLQPAHMKDYSNRADNDDSGGVHINSGIPNKAFYIFASTVGGPSWKIPGKIWYRTLVKATFGEIESSSLKRVASDHIDSLEAAWRDVGVLQS
jgi:hypothetical protein